MKIIYIAGPYSQGDVAQNVRRAMDAAIIVINHGDAPIIPHLFHFLHMVHERPYEVWTKIDIALLRTAHAVLRVPGFSDGAEVELSIARELKLPIYFSLEQLYGSAYSLQRRGSSGESSTQGVRRDPDKGPYGVDPEAHWPAPTDRTPR